MQVYIHSTLDHLAGTAPTTTTSITGGMVSNIRLLEIPQTLSHWAVMQGALQEVKHRAERSLRAPCQLVVCFIP